MRKCASLLIATFVSCAGNASEPSSGGRRGAGGAPSTDATAGMPWKNGKRLQARTIDGGAGAFWFMGWNDVALGVACSFRAAADGALRCLPDEIWPKYFTDSNCSDYFVPQISAPKPAFVRVQKASQPDAMFAFCPKLESDGVLELGVPVTVPAFYESDANGVCTRATPGANVTGWQATPVSPTRFVAAEVAEVGAGGLRAHIYSGEEGSREVVGFFDQERSRCELAWSRRGEGPMTCLPVAVGLRLREMDGFVDASCSSDQVVNVAGAWNVQGCEPTLAASQVLNACGGVTFDIWHLGPRVAGRYYRGTTGLDCSSTVIDGTFDFLHFHVLRESAKLEDFPAQGFLDFGTGRLKARFGTTENGVAARNPVMTDGPSAFGELRPTFFDSLRNAPCSPERIADGTRRCLPHGIVPTGIVYTDAACSEPAALVSMPPDSGCLVQSQELVSAPFGLGLVPRPLISDIYEVENNFMDRDIYLVSEKTGICIRDAELRNRAFRLKPVRRLDLASFPSVHEELF